jgi:hypothetical protein
VEPLVLAALEGVGLDQLALPLQLQELRTLEEEVAAARNTQRAYQVHQAQAAPVSSF